MSFRRGGGKRRRDSIEPDIIRTLRSYGVEVYQINGRALPDLLCGFRGRWVPLGVKSGEKARLTASERAGKASWPMVRSVTEAIREVVGATDAAALESWTESLRKTERAILTMGTDVKP